MIVHNKNSQICPSKSKKQIQRYGKEFVVVPLVYIEYSSDNLNHCILSLKHPHRKGSITNLVVRYCDCGRLCCHANHLHMFVSIIVVLLMYLIEIKRNLSKEKKESAKLDFLKLSTFCNLAHH